MGMMDDEAAGSKAETSSGSGGLSFGGSDPGSSSSAGLSYGGSDPGYSTATNTSSGGDYSNKSDGGTSAFSGGSDGGTGSSFSTYDESNRSDVGGIGSLPTDVYSGGLSFGGGYSDQYQTYPNNYPVASSFVDMQYPVARGPTYGLVEGSSTGGFGGRQWSLPGGGAITTDELVNHVIKQESDWDPNAVSPKGALGLMQMTKGTASRPGFGLNDEFADLGISQDPSLLFDPEIARESGTLYLDAMLSNFEGDIPTALAAYNAGPTAVNNYGGIPPYKETQGYVSSIMGNIEGGETPYTSSFSGAGMNALSYNADGFLGAVDSDPMTFTEEDKKAYEARMAEKNILDKYGKALPMVLGAPGLALNAINNLQNKEEQKVYEKLTGTYENDGVFGTGFMASDATSYQPVRDPETGEVVGALGVDDDGNAVDYSGDRISGYDGFGAEFVNREVDQIANRTDGGGTMISNTAFGSAGLLSGGTGTDTGTGSFSDRFMDAHFGEGYAGGETTPTSTTPTSYSDPTFSGRVWPRPGETTQTSTSSSGTSSGDGIAGALSRLFGDRWTQASSTGGWTRDELGRWTLDRGAVDDVTTPDPCPAGYAYNATTQACELIGSSTPDFTVYNPVQITPGNTPEFDAFDFLGGNGSDFVTGG